MAELRRRLENTRYTFPCESTTFPLYVSLVPSPIRFPKPELQKIRTRFDSKLCQSMHDLGKTIELEQFRIFGLTGCMLSSHSARV